MKLPNWIYRYRVVLERHGCSPGQKRGGLVRLFLTRSGTAWVADARHAGTFIGTRPGAKAFAAALAAQAEDVERGFVL